MKKNLFSFNCDDSRPAALFFAGRKEADGFALSALLRHLDFFLEIQPAQLIAISPTRHLSSSL